MNVRTSHLYVYKEDLSVMVVQRERTGDKERESEREREREREREEHITPTTLQLLFMLLANVALDV